MIIVASHGMKGPQAHSWGHTRKGGNTGMTEKVRHCFLTYTSPGRRSHGYMQDKAGWDDIARPRSTAEQLLVGRLSTSYKPPTPLL